MSAGTKVAKSPTKKSAVRREAFTDEVSHSMPLCEAIERVIEAMLLVGYSRQSADGIVCSLYYGSGNKTDMNAVYDYLSGQLPTLVTKE